MKQHEAVIKALEILGGKAELKHITLIALSLSDVDWSNAKEPEANIRRIVRHTPKSIKPIGKAQYALVSYVSEIDEYKSTIANQQKEIEELKNIETASHFIKRFICGIKKMLKHELKALDEIRKLFIMLGFEKEAEGLDNMIEQGKNNLTVSGEHIDVYKNKFEGNSVNIEEIQSVNHLQY